MTRQAWIYSDVQNTGWQTVAKRTTNNLTFSATTQDNLVGSPATITYPSGRTITYTYDSLVRPSEAQDITNNINYALGSCANGLSSSGACYAPQGTIAQVQNGANLVSTYIFNPRLQPCWMYTTTGTPLPASTGCTGSATTGTILDFKYSFNLGSTDNGNVIAITNNRASTRSLNFTYDALNRLLTAETTSTYATSPANCWGEAYIYDNQSSGGGAWGNLTNINVASSAYNGCTQESLSVTADNYNRINSTTNGYDTAGNLTSTPAPGAASYTYNAENQMTQAVTSSTTGYVYDGDGKRVEKTSGGSAFKLYWYDLDGDVLDETDGTGSFTNTGFSEYVFFGGQRIARRDSSGNIFYYFADHLGTAREIVQAGQTSACYESDFYPFGGERSPIVNSCTQNNYKFTGKERDSESGLDNFGVRYNASSLGRFMSPDPEDDSGFENQGDPQSWNAYSYVRNNPMTFTDPDGRDYRVCVDNGNGGQNCVNYANMTDFQNALKDTGATLQNGQIIVNVNGQNQATGTYQFFVGPGVEGEHGIQDDPIIFPVFEGAAIGSTVSAGRGFLEGLLGSTARDTAQGVATSVVQSTGTEAITQSVQISGHALIEAGKDGVTKDAIRKVIQAGERFYDPANNSIVYVVKGGMASGKGIAVATDATTGVVKTVFTSSKSVIRSRFIPID